MEGQPVKGFDSQTEKAPQAIIRFVPDHNQASRTSAIDLGSINPAGIPSCRVDQHGVTFLARADDANAKEKTEQEVEKTGPLKQGVEQFNGSLYLIGGSARKCFDEVVKLAGEHPRVAVVGLASGTDAERANKANTIDEDLAEAFVTRGIAPGDITIVKSKGFQPTQNRFKYSYDIPATSTLVYFGGGDQARLRERFDDTQLSQIKKLLVEGCVISGNSAGTAVMPRMMIADGEVKNLASSPGFGLTPWAIMDTHVDARPIRIQRDVKAYFDVGNQKLPVIGLDEDTSLKISWKNRPVLDGPADASAPVNHAMGNGLDTNSDGQKNETRQFKRVLVAEVSGRGQAHIIDAKQTRLKFTRAITPRPSTNGLDNREAFLYELSANDSFEFPDLP